jgi:hypothetical protein
MGHLEGNFTPVLYMGRKVPKGSLKNSHAVPRYLQIMQNDIQVSLNTEMQAKSILLGYLVVFL